MKGIVKWYSQTRGYGFITTKDQGDIFVHRSVIPKGVVFEKDDKILFDIEKTEKGTNAVNIRKV